MAWFLVYEKKIAQQENSWEKKEELLYAREVPGLNHSITYYSRAIETANSKWKGIVREYGKEEVKEPKLRWEESI